MIPTAFEKKGEGFKPWKVVSAFSLSLLLLFGQTAPVLGNPTGGAIVAGSATIGSAGTTLTINQSTRNAIINWQQFSIASGELTKFIVPNASSATLNRVVGGNPSAIYGGLQSNGILYLVNPSGIVVGPSGRIDTASFLASTLDVSNQQFLRGGNLNFSGASDASIDNQGIIHASSGDVYLVANQVNNNGTLSAPQGTVGLAAGSDILFQQAGNQHLFVQATPAGTTRATGVTNAGTIQAAAAELKAAGGNAYALAINNTGSIAATGYKKVNGQVYLTSGGGNITNGGQISARTATGKGGTIVMNGSGASSSGTVLNSGTLDASSTVAGGQGGSVSLKNSGGKAIQSGKILAKGGQGGAGGNVEVSGASVQPTGTVDTTALGGTTGNLLIDPATWLVAASGGDQTGAQVAAMLATSNLTLNADTLVTIDDAVTWTSANTLTLSTNTTGSAMLISQPISGINGGLTLAGFNSSVVIGTDTAGSVNVADFILQSGTWTQSSATLPAFTASHDFEIQNGSTFTRLAGGVGSGVNPFQIADIYGLQGLGSSSGSFLGVNIELVNNIDATGTASWNSGAGFVPIATFSAQFTGTFDGQGHTIDGLHINLPGTNGVGLFGWTASTATIQNVGLTNVQISGLVSTGALVGNNTGTISNVFSTGSITAASGSDAIGGLVGSNNGTISRASSTATVTAVSGVNYGGLVGYNTGTVSNAFSTGVVTTSGGNGVGGLVGFNNGGTINKAYSTGAVSGTANVGGFVGYNGGTITNSFWDTDTSGITSSTGGVGGGTNSGVTAATTIQLGTQSFILANATTSPTYDFTSVWTTNGDTTTPQLIGQPTGSPGVPTTDTLNGTAFSDNGLTFSAGVTIDLIFNGSLLGSTTTDSSGGFTFSISSTDLTGGILLTDATNQGNTFYQANNPAGIINGIDLWGSTLRVVADAASNTALGQAVGGLTGMGVNYAVSGANLSTNAGVAMSILSHYALDGNITASGAVILHNATVTLGGGSFTISGTGGGSNLDGIDVLASTIDTQGGSVTLTGQAGFVNDVDQGGNVAGIGVVVNDSLLETASSGESSLTGGNITINGNGSVGTTVVNQLIGVDVDFSAASVVNGVLSINGNVDNSTVTAGVNSNSGKAAGVIIEKGSVLQSKGTGSLSVIGSLLNTTASDSNLAVDIGGGGTNASANILLASAGSIFIHGMVTSGTADLGTAGVVIHKGSQVTASGTGGSAGATAQGDVTILGTTTGSTTQSIDGGVFIEGVGTVVSASGIVADAHGGTGLTITGTSTTINGSTGATVDRVNGIGGTFFEPMTVGIGVVNGATIETLGSALMTLDGTGGTNANTLDSSNGFVSTTNGGTSASYGVAVFSPVDGQTTTLSSGGSLSITGHAGSSPTTGVGVMIGGPSNAGTVSVTSAGAITLDGTGGAGNAGDTGAIPNAGVAIFDPGNDTGEVGLHANGGNLTITGAAGTGGLTGVDAAPYFNAFYNSSSIDPSVTTSGTLRIISTSGLVNNSGMAGGITAQNTIVTAPVGTNSVVTVGASAGPLSLNGGAFTVSGYPAGILTLAASSVTSLSVTNQGGININGIITGSGPITLKDLAGNITFAAGGAIIDSGSGNDVILAAGTDLASAHEIINHSTVGGNSGNAIQVSGGAHFFLYSSDPALDTLGGITVQPANVVFNATYPAASLPSGDSELFYVATSGGGGGGGGDGGGGTPPPPSTATGGAAGGGSNIVPPALVPQQPPPGVPPPGILGNILPPPLFNFTGNGTSGLPGQQDGGFANSSSGGGQVGAGDAAQLGGDGLNNVANPQAAGALSQALGPVVYHSLQDALKALGDWAAADLPGSGGNAAGGGDEETILEGGEVAEMGDKGIKNIPPDQAPEQLKNAMKGDVLNGMRSGTGH